MVLTTGHYMDRYARRRGAEVSSEANATQTFLEALFRIKNLLFVGYGLDELEILEYVILKARREGDAGKAAKHFILQPFFSHEIEVANGIATYFQKECGVTLIPFLRDVNGHAQLIDVIESFALAIPIGFLLEVERRYAMDRLLDV